MNSELTTVTGMWVEQRLRELAQLTDISGEMTRLTLSPAHKAAAARLKMWFEQAGMTTRLDGTGTLIGRYEASVPQANSPITNVCMKMLPSCSKATSCGLALAPSCLSRSLTKPARNAGPLKLSLILESR